MSTQARLGATLAVAVLGSTAFVYWMKPAQLVSAVPAPVHATGSAGQPRASVAQGHPAAQPWRMGVSAFVTGVEDLPQSLQGTEVDGGLEVDANGQLKITRAVRNLFDYFLSAQGEEDRDRLVQRIRAYIHFHLKGVAAGQAEHLLGQYLLYQQALKGLPPVAVEQQDYQQIRAQMQQIRDLRSRYFDRVTQAAFFEDEQAYDDYTLARLEILNDPQRSTALKSSQLKELARQQPVSLQEDLRVLNQYQDLTALTQEWRDHGGSPAQLRQIREQIVGAAAADRLEALDQENGQWDQRIDVYMRQRAQILQQPGLAPVDQQRAITELRGRLFDSRERLRLDAIETMREGRLTSS